VCGKLKSVYRYDLSLGIHANLFCLHFTLCEFDLILSSQLHHLKELTASHHFSLLLLEPQRSLAAEGGYNTILRSLHSFDVRLKDERGSLSRY
jgi:hypothetical protein